MSAQNISELGKIQDTISKLATIEEGNFLNSLLAGPVHTFFDPQNFKDKEALEEHIQNSLEELCESYAGAGVK